jgi:hypothetical protein
VHHLYKNNYYPALEWNSSSSAEYDTEIIKRTINLFYHCQAVFKFKLGERCNSIIILYGKSLFSKEIIFNGYQSIQKN